MPGIAPAIDYTARTFEVIRKRALEVLKNRLGPTRFNDTIATGVVPAVLDVLAWFHEQNAHYYDRRHRNTLLELADTRESMVVLTRAQGYRMRPATSASVAVIAAPTPPQPVPITLTKGTRITVGTLTFEIGVDAIIPASKPLWPDITTSELIVFVEGATRTEAFVSDGSKFQKFELGQPNTIEGSIAVKVLGETWEEVESLVFIEGDQRGRDTFNGDGTDDQAVVLGELNAVVDPKDEDAMVVLITPVGGGSSAAQRWQQVDAFTGAAHEFTVSQTVDGVSTINFGLVAKDSAPLLGEVIDVYYVIAGAQKRYQTTFDPDDRATVRFGDGVFGVIPPTGASIQVTYRVGGGVQGNVLAGTINTVVQGVLPSGAKTPVIVRNIEAGRGGEPPETVDHARFFAPKRAKANERAVTREDYTALAATFFDKLYGAPSHASAYLKQQIPELNTVTVAVWGRDTFGQVATANTPLKLGIKNFLDTKRTICTVVEMVDGTVVLMDVEALITLKPGEIRAAVFADVTRAVQTFFSSTRVLPGINLSISQLYDAIQQTPGVSRAEITRVTGSVAVVAVVTPVTGDGVTNLFAGQFTLPEGTTIVAKSLVVTDGVQQVVDDGNGAFSGDISLLVPAGSPGNTNDLTAGTFSVTFTGPPPIGRTLSASAKVTVFFGHTENLGSSDGNVLRIDGATDYYPIVKRAPRGLWSGDQHKVVDGFRVGTTSEIRGRLPSGILPNTLSVNYPAGGGQTVIDNGIGVIVTSPGGVPVGSVDYVQGDIDFTFATPLPTVLLAPIRAQWHTRKIDIFLPADLLPLEPGRVFIWGGFGDDGLEPPAELVAYDDGEGNIAGNVLPGGTISYSDGHILAEWNADPPPGPAGGGALTGTLGQVPDGTRRTFTFTTGGNLGTGGLGGIGRTRLQLSDISTVGFTIEDAYDNWQGVLNGASLDRLGANFVSYGSGTGTITFKAPPPVGSPTTFAVQVTNVGTFLYAGWVFRVKTPGTPGLDKGLFADNNGRFWGPPAAGPSDAFPTARLDQVRGRYYGNLAGSPIAKGRALLLSYDALTGVPPALDIVVEGNQLAAAGSVILTENPAGDSPNG